MRSLIGAGLIQVLLAIIVNPSTDNHLIEICLCVLRSVYERNFAPREIINTNLPTLVYLIGKYDTLIERRAIVFFFHCLTVTNRLFAFGFGMDRSRLGGKYASMSSMCG